MSRRLRVLIVDDDDELRRMFRQALTFAGFEVHEAGDGLAALHSLDNWLHDAVVLDLGLPIISGHAVQREIAANAYSRDIPVIIVTGEPGPHELNVACILRKPVSPDRLIQTVRACIASGATSLKRS
jgi:two-component system cell cycle response regulator DivK